MKILATGKFEPDYNRTQTLFSGLRELGHGLSILEYQKRNRQSKRRIKEALDCSNYDLVFLPAFTHLDVRFVRKLTRLPLIFDPLISRYLTKVFDYRTISRYNPRAYKNYLKDKLSFHAADIILSDTRAHADYYSRLVKDIEHKIRILPVGVNTELFYPVEEKKEKNKFVVGFYGSFIPLQGIDKIIQAAELLKACPDIEFHLIGHGVGFQKIAEKVEEKRMNNVQLTGWVPFEQLNEKIHAFDLCLGIFGDSLKAQLVVPNKIYHYAACSKGIITMDTQAIHEIFEPGTNIITCSNHPKEIADKIMECLRDQDKVEHIALKASEMIRQDYNHVKIAGKFEKIALSLLSGK